MVVLVPGDMTEECFGISVETLCRIEEEVTIIIHAAANISFRAPLLKVAAIVQTLVRISVQ